MPSSLVHQKLSLIFSSWKVFKSNDSSLLIILTRLHIIFFPRSFCKFWNIFLACKVKGTLHIGTIRAAVHHINSTRLTRNPLSPYFRGCWARVLQAAPGCALSWIAYEFMKTVLEAETAQKKVDTGKDLNVYFVRTVHDESSATCRVIKISKSWNKGIWMKLM